MLCSLELGNVTILSLILMLKCHNNRYQREIFQYRNIACSINIIVNNIIILRFIALKHAKSMSSQNFIHNNYLCIYNFIVYKTILVS